MRFLDRNNHELRNVTIEKDFIKNADGSCLISFGNTKVICTATIEEKAPAFLYGKNSGWVTAEYSMIPRATHSRVRRESIIGKQTGRTQEIQRLIGRSLRAAIDLKILGPRQIIIDCDVIQADGGTRTASITGAYVALIIAIEKLLKQKIIKSNPIIRQIASISCGIINGQVMIDLDYDEDSNAEVDANFVMDQEGKIIEIQASSEKKVFSQDELIIMLKLANQSIQELIKLQIKILSKLPQDND